MFKYICLICFPTSNTDSDIVKSSNYGATVIYLLYMDRPNELFVLIRMSPVLF